MKENSYKIIVIMKDGSKHITESIGTSLEIIREVAYIQETFGEKISIFDLLVYN